MSEASKADAELSSPSSGSESDGNEDQVGQNASDQAAARSRKRRRDMSPKSLREFWQRKKQEKKQRKKERAAQRQEEQRKQWDSLTEQEKEDIRAKAALVHECRRRQEEELEQRCSSSISNPSTPCLLFDLSFADLMNEGGVKSTMSQIKFSFSLLRRFGFPMRPIVTSVEGQFEQLRTFEGFKRYPPVMTERHWRDSLAAEASCVDKKGTDAAVSLAAEPDGEAEAKPTLLLSKKSIVYLTADSESVLLDIEPNTVYIVGAFVDHNCKKGATLQLATNVGVRTARLPIDEFINVGNLCKVLTINTVVDVLCRFSETKSWPLAFEALPTRRQ